ncbi:MAG: hypothetical protein Q4C46_06105 [Bacillota bacterium]|nr:hypothetical protein [Bacillota bacterium]
MNRFSMWFSGLLRGRYGVDNLNRFLLIASVVLIVLDWIVPGRILYLLAVFALIYVYCRMFSRNINARYRENQKFLEFTGKFRNRTAGGFTARKDKTHKILHCPGCGEKLRVPKGAGKISINCPHCGTSFIKKV